MHSAPPCKMNEQVDEGRSAQSSPNLNLDDTSIPDDGAKKFASSISVDGLPPPSSSNATSDTESEHFSSSEVHEEDEIGTFDILCGRCSNAFNNIGNRRFRLAISANVHNYLAARTKLDKTALIQSVIQGIRQVGGRFLRKHQGKYVCLEENKVREKVGHALRDLSVMTLPNNKGNKQKKKASRKASPTSLTERATTPESVDAKPSAIEGPTNQETATSSSPRQHTTGRGKTNEEAFSRYLDVLLNMCKEEQGECSLDPIPVKRSK